MLPRNWKEFNKRDSNILEWVELLVDNDQFRVEEHQKRINLKVRKQIKVLPEGKWVS